MSIFIRRYLAFSYEADNDYHVVCPDFPEFIVASDTRENGLRHLEKILEQEVDGDTPAEDEATVPNKPGIRVHLIQVDVEEK